MKLVEPILLKDSRQKTSYLPHTVKEKIQDILPLEEEERICVSTDLNPDGTFGTQWVFVTDKRVLIVPTEGADGVVQVPIKELTSARTEPLVLYFFANTAMRKNKSSGRRTFRT